MFCDGYKGKEAFLVDKNIGSKNHPNFHFFKEVSPWFLSKNGDFLMFSFYANWMKKKCFLKVPKKKEAFLEQKNIGSKNHQNLPFFFKLVSPWFLSKSEDF